MRAWSPAGVGGIEWDALNAEVMKEWGQLGDLYLPVDQSSLMGIAGGRAMARRMNMIFSMVHNMQFRMLKSEGLFTQIQSSVSFMSVRIEEAFKKVDSVVSDIDKKNVDLLVETRREAGVEFQRLSNEGSSVRDDLSRMKLEAEAALTQLKIEQEKC